MRIVMLGKWPTNRAVSGGVAIHTLNLVKEIGKSKESEFCLISFSESNGMLSEGYAKIVLMRSQRIYYVLPFLALLRLWVEVRKLKPDIIHVQGGNISPYLLYTIFLARNVKKIVTMHSYPVLELVVERGLKVGSFRYQLLKWIDGAVYNKSDVIIAVGERLKQWIEQNRGLNKTIVIANGVDPALLRPELHQKSEIAARGIFKGGFAIFYGKSFVNRNGHEYLIRAMPSILKQIPSARLILTGDGILREYLINLTAEMGLEDDVFFAGELPHEEVLAYMAAADCVVVPSVNILGFEEPGGIVLLEAMALGKACIASRVGGLAESIVDHENGILVPDKNAEALADAVVEVFRNPWLAQKLQANARTYVVRERTWEEVVRRLIKLYSELLSH